MAPPFKLSSDNAEQLVADYRAGSTATALTERYGINLSSVCRYLDLAGVEREMRRRSPRAKRTICRVCGIAPVECKQGTCKLCQASYLRNYHLVRTFGITAERFDEILAEQGGGCAWCGRSDIQLVVDHDRRCCPGRKSCGKCLRGILCTRHNQALGLLGESYLGTAVEWVDRRISSART